MTRAEFDAIVDGFIEEYNATEGDYLEEWTTVDVVIHCRTAGCVREGISEEVNLPVPLDRVWKIVCGRCSRPVEDIDPQLSDDPDYRLPARYPDGSSWMVIND